MALGTFLVGGLAVTSVALLIKGVKKLIENIVGNAKSSFTTSNDLDFVGMSSTAVEEITKAINTYISMLEEHLEKFRNFDKYDNAFKGEIKEGVDIYNSAIIDLLQAYITAMRQNVEDMKNANTGYVESTTALAGNIQEDANEIRISAKSINLEDKTTTTGAISAATVGTTVGTAVGTNTQGTTAPTTSGSDDTLIGTQSEDPTADLGETPTGSNDTPTGGNDTPTGGNDTPTGGNDTPTGGNDTPTGGNDTPTGGNDTPTGDNDTPTGGNDTPTGGNDTPSNWQPSGGGGGGSSSGGFGSGSGGTYNLTGDETTTATYDWETVKASTFGPDDEVTNLISDSVEELDINDIKNTTANMAKTIKQDTDTGLSKGAIIGMTAGATTIGGGTAAAIGIHKHKVNAQAEKESDKINLSSDEFFDKYGYREGTRFDQ